LAEANGCCPERGHRTGARWFHPGGRGCRRAAKRGRARLPPSRQTWEGEAPAEPRNVGGRGSCRAAKRGRARLLPSRQTWEGEAPAEPPNLGGRGSCRAVGASSQTAVRLSGSFALPRAARQVFGSAGASPSQGRPDRCLAQQELRPPKGGQTGGLAQQELRPPKGGQTGGLAQRELRPPKGQPDSSSAQQELRPPKGGQTAVWLSGSFALPRGGQTGVWLSGSFALPKGRPDRCSAQRELRPPEGAARRVFGSAGASPSRRGGTRGKPICSCAQDFALIRILWGRVGARRPQTSGPLCEFDCVPLLSIARGWPCEQGHMLMVKG